MSNIKVEMLSINDFDHICRTCSSGGELKSLFDNIEALSMLESFTQMQFSKSDELPEKICTKCLRKIYECFHFINNCKIIDEGFRKCLTNNIKQLEIKTNELHSSIDIKDEEEPKSPTDIKQECINDQSNPESNENIKEIDVKQSEYYILKWGSPSENEENQKFQLTVVNNSSNEQGQMEQPLRGLQAMTKMEKIHTLVHNEASDEAHTIESEKKLPTFSIIGGNDQISANIIDQRANLTEELHRARAKLTLPHEEHNAITRRNYETPEKIALQRALARKQLRKIRNKLTADETAEHRAQVSENMRKFRVKLQEDTQARDYIRRFRGDIPSDTKTEKSQDLQIPLRLSEMAQTLLQLNDPLRATSPPRPAFMQNARFSLRPTKIPQVKKECFEVRSCSDEHQESPKFRSWKRNIESPDEATLRLATTRLQKKRMLRWMKEPCPLEESALRRARAAGQLRQYRPMLRKNTTNIQQ